jgi:hypothetical protein
METEAGEGRAMVVRVRCVKCRETSSVTVMRENGCLVVPAAIVHSRCGTRMKVLNRELAALMMGRVEL